MTEQQRAGRCLPAPLLAAVVALLGARGAVPAHAETQAAFCKRIGTDDTTQSITADLVPAVNEAFAMRLSVREPVATTVFRCVGGHVTVCTAGANLPCGKANADRAPNPGMAQWCHDDPNAAFIPAVATGHDTIYEWRCRSGVPQVVRQFCHVDSRGFVAEFWKALP